MTVATQSFDYDTFVEEFEPENFTRYPDEGASAPQWQRLRREAAGTYALTVIKDLPNLPGVILYTFGINHTEDDDWIRYFMFSNGQGLARDGQYKDWGEIAHFTWNPAEVLDQSKNISTQLRQHILDRFRTEINDQLGEAALIPEADRGEELVFTTGSKEELEKLARLVVYSFPEIQQASNIEEGIYVHFIAEGKHVNTESSFLGLTSEEYWDEEDNWAKDFNLSAVSADRLIALLNFAARQNHMVGETLEYNDGAYNRMSGYDWRTPQIEIMVPPPSMHEAAEARSELRQLLSHNMSQTEIDELLPAE